MERTSKGDAKNCMTSLSMIRGRNSGSQCGEEKGGAMEGDSSETCVSGGAAGKLAEADHDAGNSVQFHKSDSPAEFERPCTI